MAKKTVLKKSKRRLKRTVRRSIAAVLMVTAIAVAAIPVPENLADESDETTGGDAGIRYVDATSDEIVDNPGKTANPYVDYTDAQLADAVAGDNPKLVQTEIVAQSGSSLVLTWQFLYEPINEKRGRLCRYNNEFPQDVVNLSLKPNKSYFAVKASQLDCYFGVNGAEPRSCGISGMDNLTPNSKFYPTKPLTYSYLDYDPDSNQVTLADEVKNFFQKYYENDFNMKTEQFKAYYAANDLSKDLPEDLEKRPADLNSDQKMEFFCEHNSLLQGTKYGLVAAIDERFGQSNEDRVYVAYSAEAAGNLPEEYVDVDGYLVKQDERSIHTIADEAFANVQNVGQIDISDNVQYIGDSAFENSGINSVVIGNADMIGNRAFYGCQKLTTVSFTDTTDTYAIGAEAFRMSGINTPLALPWSIKQIGHGAFSSCLSLTEVRFDDKMSGCVVGDYAFFDDTRLTTVNFGTAMIENLGNGCFAVQSPSGDSLQSFSFPSQGLNNMDEYVLANHRNLTEVNIQNYTKRIPESTFYNCFGLKKAVFSEKCGMASFGEELFRYVTDPDFCVYGPELYADGPSYPRRSTWDAVRNDGNGIPYVYESGGKTYYEMALESVDENGNRTRYRYGAGNDGELISCALIDSTVKSVDIVIPSKIGNFDIKSIGSECFSNKELRNKIKSITIQNRSVSTIADGAFRDLPILEKVRIGDSVTYIGRDAFAGCKKLYDVFFTKPSAGYEALVMDDSAFVTTGSQLTFHGDIAEDYAPFEWATDMSHVLKDQDSVNVPAINVCYQSLWDSEVGTHLTVMCDKNGVVTLLDYPKFSDLDVKNRNDLDEELRDYCKDMENYYYYTVYDSGDGVEQMRREYAYIWNAYQQDQDKVVLDDNVTVITKDEYQQELLQRYGPWINPNYCEPGFWRSYLPTSDGTGTDTGKAYLIDLLFEPIVAEAASANPIPYFKENPYNFMDNYKSYLNDPEYESFPDYKKVPDKVWTFINATQEVVVPAGVDSIDVSAYATANGDNYDTYIRKKRPAASNNMYTRRTNGATPGLFSGYYVDYAEGDQREENPNGNDHIRGVILTTVKKLPDYAFDSCEQLERVVLGQAEEIGALPFRGCGNLTNVVGNEKYPAENGIIYEQDANNAGKYRIIECLMTRGKPNTGDESLEKATIAPDPDRLISSVSEIAESAFEGCDGISVVDLSAADGLGIIPENCFKDCLSLINVKLPGTVNKIRDDAFSGIANATHPLAVTIPGREVDIADMAFDPKRNVTIYTYEDSAAYRYGKRYEGQGMKVEVLNAYRVMFYDYDGTQVGATQIVDHDTGGSKATAPPEEETLKQAGHRPGYTFSHWETTGGMTLDDPITDDMTIFIAQYESDGSMINGRYVVEFLDGIDGHRLSGRNSNDADGKYYVEPNNSFMDLGWEAPQYADHTKEGKEFLQWSNNWTENTTIDANMTIIALYRDVATSGGSSNTSGGSTNTSRGSTSGGSSNTSRGSTSSTSSNTSSSSSSTSTTSSTSNTSSSTAASFTVTVVNGSGSGTYAQGATVVIAANEPAAGMVFQKWTTESNGVTLASVSLPATTFTMPAGNVTVTANYVAATAPAANEGNNGGNGGGGNTGGSGSTRVDITKPGISNKDLATANANGTTDNFIVKITETDEATRAVAEALTNKYGSLDSILYYAMDISLWDSTGTYQLTGDQLAGITVDITIPIPDALVAYGGNNMAGAVVNGNQLENLNENFTTINGVPCIRFTASHFSPYTVYVDTGNLTEGMLDTTPKTGDPIHPKWFLSIGLACLSIILFMKKDKASKVKTA
ncbi:MAG: leucine-rich repeat protein [Lachnospiraceae bacterium]|nr:leucine-rich repeat protein [Lachnospiraceae bacterium]